jgi:hypothetical protein
MVPLLALLLAVGCSGDPTDPLRGGVTRLDAAPSQLFLQLGESKTVDISAVDEQGNQISSAYEVTATTGPVSVKRDSTFLPVYINDSTLSVPPEAPTFRYLVTATGYGPASFTVGTGGKDVTVPVQVVAQTVLDAQISNLTPALGEVVTITAPAGISFSATSTVTFAGASTQPAAVTVAPNGKSITFIPPPNISNAQATISDVVSAAAPTVPFSPVTADRLTTPEVKAFPGTVDDLTPAANQAITLTLTGATLDPAATFGIGATTPLVLGTTATTATLLPFPGATGQLLINGVVLDALPQFSLSLPAPATDTISVGAATEAAGTDDFLTAPSVPVPGVGGLSGFFDAPDFGAAADRFYKLVAPADGDYTISLDWTSGSDIDLFVCPAAGVATFDCDFAAATGNQPESSTYTLTAGTYYLVAEDFGGDAGVSTLTITVQR